MKPSEYYSDMRSINDCIAWATKVSLKFRLIGKDDCEIVLPGKRDETDISFYYDDDHDDLDFINCMNRLRRWKEGPLDEQTIMP